MLEPLTQAPPIPREAPFIWVTLITPLLAGSNNCQWAAWFQANYSFEKPAPDLNEWKINHGRLLDSRVEELEAEGHKVYIEGENQFTIRGQDKRTKVTGKADIVAVMDGSITVEDCKTGKKRDSDLMQVLTYMLLLPAPGGAPHCKGKKLEGRLVYSTEVIDIPSSMLDGDFKSSFKEITRVVSASEPARKVPSLRECRFCKVPSAYCSERVETKPDEELEDHDLF